MQRVLTKFAVIGGAVLLTGCAGFKNRKPANARSTMLNQVYSELANVNAMVAKDPLICKRSYDGLYQKLFNLAGNAAYFDSSDSQSIDDDIRDTFEARIALKDTFGDFSNKTSIDKECVTSAQDVFKALRYVEDYLVELRMEKVNSTPADYVNLKGEFPYLLVNPKFENQFKSYEDLKSGDVILSRGNAYTSAAIARIAQSDYQFSHLSFVYRDAETQELFTTEAHIEIGSVTNPFEAHLGEKNARTVVFRYKDEKIAHEASKAIFDKVKAQQETGKNFEYDFAMNFKDDSKLFCSEIVSNGFKAVLPDQDYIPRFKSNFSAGMIPFLNTIGVPVTKENIATTEVFAPGDVQFDPDFELVAEWRNPKKLEESRYKDFILTKMFESMDQQGYKIDPSFKMSSEVKAMWLLRRAPVVRKFLDKKFSLSMNTEQMEMFIALDRIGDVFFKELESKSIDYDHPMTPKEIYAVIDDFLKRDLNQWKRYKKGQDVVKPLVHLLFHP